MWILVIIIIIWPSITIIMSSLNLVLFLDTNFVNFAKWFVSLGFCKLAFEPNPAHCQFLFSQFLGSDFYNYKWLRKEPKKEHPMKIAWHSITVSINKVIWEYSHIIHLYCLAAFALIGDLNSYNRDCVGYKAWNIFYLAFYKNTYWCLVRIFESEKQQFMY